MCGYIRRVTDNAYVQALLISVGLDDLVDEFTDLGDMQHFYPAFGADPAKKISKLIINEGGAYKVIDATWWFDCVAQGDSLTVGDRTTFNARNLDSNYWRGALKQRRALVVATGIGESQIVNGRKQQYLMEGARQAFLLGALYRQFDNGCYCCAVITRPASSEFAKYHEKAMPLFVPAKAALVQEWLDPELTHSHRLESLLNEPCVPLDLQVSRVKAFKSGQQGLDHDVIPAERPDA